ncbi:hypothetical protein CAPTEDRAFT_198952 [Capitella teleta]|uniref:Uncharacterized protein n=1 Tax=Capitella teleta TaxID=283909 RepID=R7V2K7_CAPTE|nr:hypothetical protein CAPTEDRAFT_198952 [Capitella teleta]|eukprot:ELU13088.1 hypothetical protein CAPTEDRAFT_198952 [Capitella teleta]
MIRAAEKKLLQKNADSYLGLLAYRSSPLHNGLAPSEILMSQKLRTTLPVLGNKLHSKVIDHEELQQKESAYCTKYASNYNQHHKAKELPTLTPGERPPETDLRDRKQLATVASQTANPRSYTVSVPGNKLRRNRSALVRTDLHDRYVKHFGRYIIATFY